jgi:hypothetical protein
MKTEMLAMLGILLAAPALAADPATPPTAPGAPAAADAAAPTAAPKTPAGNVARAAFTRAIEDREPVDSLSSLPNDRDKIFFFTDIRDMAGAVVIHRWEYDGKIVAEIPFEIGGPRWRVYSSKNLDPSWTGEWKVSVVDGQGGTLSVKTFTYTSAPTPAPAASEQPAPAPAPAAPQTPSGGAY